jgi:hypothetical protein
MPDTHWFDAFHKTLVQDRARRGLLREAGMLVAGLAMGEAIGTAAKGRKKHHRNGSGSGGKDKGKGKQKPKKRPPPCSGGACAAQWVGDQDGIDYCEFICQQCDGENPREFCIVEADPADPAKVAVCCAESSTCCAGTCCGSLRDPHLRCCNDECANLLNDEFNCGSCGSLCGPGQVCELGSCVNQCGTGSCPATPQWSCCGVECKDILNDRNNCGACDLECLDGQTCQGGVCGCHDPAKPQYCLEPPFTGPVTGSYSKCIPQGWQCCGVTSGCGPGQTCSGTGFEAQCL